MIRYAMSAPQIDSNCCSTIHLCSEVEEGWQCALRRCRAEDHIEITAAGSQTPVACVSKELQETSNDTNAS